MNTSPLPPSDNESPRPHPCDVCGKKIFYIQVHGKSPEEDDPNLLRCEECNEVLKYIASSFGYFK